MNLVGNLEDLGLGEILQIVSLSRKSGVLTLRSRRGEGEVVFLNGEVIRASSPENRETLPELLVGKGVTDSDTVRRAQDVQQRGGSTKSLGDILSSRFNVPSDKIEKVIRERIEKTVLSFFEWNSGTFDFELEEQADAVTPLEMEQSEMMPGQGINSQYLAMEGARYLDEMVRGPNAKETDQAASIMTTSQPGYDGACAPLTSIAGEPDVDAPDEPEIRHTIVLVDDHSLTRDSLAATLEECGYEVFPFAGGADSPLMRLASLHREGEKPTLLLDLFMPRMDGSGITGGLELLDLIQANFPDIPVLAMADSRDEEAENRLRAMGIPLVMKPSEEDMGEHVVLNDFMAELLPELTRVRLCQGLPDKSGNVNLGEELLNEIGEITPSDYGPVVQSTGLTLLRGMLEELKAPAPEGGIILLVLRFASEFMNRGVMFSIKREKIEGRGQFGINPASASADSIIRGIKIPRKDDSIFSQVIESGISLKIKPDDGIWTRYLLENLGGEPAEFFLGPIVSEGKAVALLYGDNFPEYKPIGDTDSLEIFLSQAGVALEKALLQRKLKGKGLEGM